MQQPFLEVFTKKIFAILLSDMERYAVPVFNSFICKEIFFVVDPYYRKGQIFLFSLTSLIAMSRHCIFKKVIKYDTLITFACVKYKFSTFKVEYFLKV